MGDTRPARIVRTAAAVLVGLALTLTTAFADEPGPLRVYSALSDEHLKRYAAAFYAAHPEIRIEWVTASTGEIAERILNADEKERGDAVYGLAATSMARLAQAGLLASYRPQGLETLVPRFRDNADPPRWVGMNAWIGAVCVNTIELAARRLPVPRTWRELASTIYRELISMPSPESSGTGFMHLSAWVQIMGEEKAWAYMEKLHKNIKAYTERGDAPCTQAARGEVAIGISFAHRGVKSLRQGAPVQILLPPSGVGWDVGASAVLSSARNAEAARTLVDWSISPAANALYNESYLVLGVQGLSQDVKYLPDNVISAMIDNDLAWAAEHRDRLVAEWRRRFAITSAETLKQ